jgi:putative transposase
VAGMNKAYKFRIYPNAEQAVMFAKTFGCVRFIYNKMLGDKIAHYNENQKDLNCYPSQYKAEFLFLKEVDSLALVGAQNNLKTAYKNFFRDKAISFPKFKSKKNNHRSYTTNCINGNIKLVDGSIVLPKIGFVKIKRHRQIPENYTLKSVTVSKTPSDKYYASILFEYEENIEPVEIESVVGLDFSMTELYVDSNGNEANYPRYYRRKLEKLQKMSRTLSKMKKFSNNWHKQKQRIASLHEKIANQRKDFLHKQSRQIANAYDLVGVEDLNMKAMSQLLNFGKSVTDNSWGMFRTLLKYKLEEQSKYFVTIDKFFPSSKLCNICGHKNVDLTLSVREWICPDCKTVHNRDVNAAINIRNEAVRIATA